MNGYELSRQWWDFAFANPEKVKPLHGALYFFAVEHCNRLGWKRKFGLPTEMAKEALGVKSWHTYINAFNDLIDWGFFELIERSKNQYSSNIIALSKFDETIDKALDKALSRHGSKQLQSTDQRTDSIYKLITNNLKPITDNYAKFEKFVKDLSKDEKSDKKIPPNIEDVKSYCQERENDVDPERWFNFYSAKNWMIGKNKMKDWKAAVRTWEKSKTDKQDEKAALKAAFDNPKAYNPRG